MNNIRPNALIIIRKDNYILASKGIDGQKTFYRLMGGGIEFGELSKDAIKREILEELGLEIMNEKFLCVTENVFDYKSQKCHEITFLYQGDFVDKSMYEKEKIKRLDYEGEYSEWILISEIKNSNILLYPVEAIEYL
jgi:ADP-ribose pyrophosphatase YjhB (NUDIX family)